MRAIYPAVILARREAAARASRGVVEGATCVLVSPVESVTSSETVVRRLVESQTEHPSEVLGRGKRPGERVRLSTAAAAAVEQRGRR